MDVFEARRCCCCQSMNTDPTTRTPAALFVAYGTRGDVQPVLCIACHIQHTQANLQTVVVTHATHKVWVEPLLQGRKLITHYVPTLPAGKWSQPPSKGRAAAPPHSQIGQAQAHMHHTNEYLATYEAVTHHLPHPAQPGTARPPALLIFNLFALECYHISEALQIPCAVAAPYLIPYRCPSNFTKQFQRTCPTLYQKLTSATDNQTSTISWREVEHWMWPLFNEQRWQGLRGYLSLPRDLLYTHSGAVVCPLPSPPPLLYGFSELFVPRPGFWPHSVHVCGSWTPSQCCGLLPSSLPEEVQAVLDQHNCQQTANQHQPSSQQPVTASANTDGAAAPASYGRACTGAEPQRRPCTVLGKRHQPDNTSGQEPNVAESSPSLSNSGGLGLTSPVPTTHFAKPTAPLAHATRATAAHQQAPPSDSTNRRWLGCVDLGSMGRLGLIPNPDHLLTVLGRALQQLQGDIILLTSNWQPLHTAHTTLDPTLRPHIHPMPHTVSHALLLPHCHLILHPGGSGTTAAALLAGTPQVLVPLHFDQFFHAERCEHLGLAPPPLPAEPLLGRHTLAQQHPPSPGTQRVMEQHPVSEDAADPGAIVAQVASAGDALSQHTADSHIDLQRPATQPGSPGPGECAAGAVGNPPPGSPTMAQQQPSSLTQGATERVDEDTAVEDGTRLLVAAFCAALSPDMRQACKTFAEELSPSSGEAALQRACDLLMGLLQSSRTAPS